MGCEGDRSIVIKARWSRLLGDRNQARRLPQHRDLLLLQAQVEEGLKDLSQLESTGLQDPGADAIRSCSLALVESPQLSPNLVSRHREVGRRGVTASVGEGPFEVASQSKPLTRGDRGGREEGSRGVGGWRSPLKLGALCPCSSPEGTGGSQLRCEEETDEGCELNLLKKQFSSFALSREPPG